MSATTSDPVLVNNSASASTTVDPVADLSLTKTDSPDPVLSGQPAHLHRSRSTTTGPSSATERLAQRHAAVRRDVRLRHAHAGQLRRTPATASPARSARSPAGRPRPSRSRSTPARPARSRTRPRALSTATDPNSANNSASATTTVKPVADLALTKIRLARPGAGRPAADLHPRRLERRSARAPPGVTVTDTLPASVDVRLGHALAGQLLAVGGHGHMRARHGRERRHRERRRSRCGRTARAASPTRRASPPTPAT